MDLWAQIRQQGKDDAAPPPPGVFAPIPDVPPVLPPSQQPNVTMAPTPTQQNIANDQQQLQKVRWAQSHPWGTPENHPGKLGKIAHVLSVAGNIAGDIFAPDMTARIPGSQLNMQEKEQGLTHRLNEEVGQESQNRERAAQTANFNAEAAQEPEKAKSLEDYQSAETKKINDEIQQGPSLATAYAHAVNQAMQQGRDPGTDPVVQHLADAITSIQKQQTTHVDTPQELVYKDLVAKGKTPEQALEATKERPPVVRVETPSEQRAGKNDILKAYAPTQQSAERINVMTDAYEKAIKNHDQQAMLNLLANHLGMTMGLQKGARMTKDIIHEAQQSQPWLQGMAAKFDKDGYLSGVTLSPQQMRQMVNLGQQRYIEDAKTSRSTAQYLGAKDDGPERIPGPATIRYYTALANGDPNKAKQLASDDGWTVK